MTHLYEKNIVEIKNEYTTFLINIITPQLYEGIQSMYTEAIKIHTDITNKKIHDNRVNSPGILKLFQFNLKDVVSLNNQQIESEYRRIKEKTRCSEWFDDLVKATIKSNIILLTYTTKKTPSTIVQSKFHERIIVSDFIHKCYIECARSFYNNPELFWHKYDKLQTKKNQKEIYTIIEKSINNAITNMLPMRTILTEYLSNDYIKTGDDYQQSEAQYANIKDLVKSDMHQSRSRHHITPQSNQHSQHSRHHTTPQSQHQSTHQSQNSFKEIFEKKQSPQRQRTGVIPPAEQDVEFQEMFKNTRQKNIGGGTAKPNKFYDEIVGKIPINDKFADKKNSVHSQSASDFFKKYVVY